MSFPIAVHSETTYRPSSQPQQPGLVDLTIELGSTVADLAGRMFGRLRRENEDLVKPAFVPATINVYVLPVHRLATQDKVALARNPQTDIATLEALLADGDDATRSELIFNPSTPASLLKRLSQNPNRFIAAQAKARLSLCA